MKPIAELKAMIKPFIDAQDKLYLDRYNTIASAVKEGQLPILEEYGVNSILPEAKLQISEDELGLTLSTAGLALNTAGTTVSITYESWRLKLKGDERKVFHPECVTTRVSTTGYSLSQTSTDTQEEILAEINKIVKATNDLHVLLSWLSNTDTVELLAKLFENSNKIHDEYKDLNYAQIDGLSDALTEARIQAKNELLESLQPGDDVTEIINAISHQYDVTYTFDTLTRGGAGIRTIRTSQRGSVSKRSFSIQEFLAAVDKVIS